MPISSPEINIKELVLQGPEDQPLSIFDPERDVPEEVWKSIEKDFIGALKYIEQLNAYQTAKILRVIAPHRFQKLDQEYQVLDMFRKNTRTHDGLEWYINTKNYDGLTPRLTDLKLAFPHEVRQSYGISAQSMFELTDYWGTFKGRDNPGINGWVGFAEAALGLKVFLPGKFEEGFISQSQWQKMKEHYSKWDYQTQFDPKINFYTLIKLLSPEKAAQFEPTDKLVDRQKELLDIGLESAKEGIIDLRVPNLPLALFRYQILLAKDIQFGTDGLELTIPKTTHLAPSNQPIPESRRF